LDGPTFIPGFCVFSLHPNDFGVSNGLRPPSTTERHHRLARNGSLSASDWLGSDQTFACYVLTTGGHKIQNSVKGIGHGPLATVR